MNTHASTPSVTHLSELLHRLAAATPRLTAEFGIPNNWCIGAAGLTQKVLARNGYEGVRVLGASVAVHSHEAWSRRCQRVPSAQWPIEAWSTRTTSTGEIDETGWDGHAVAYVPARIAGGQAWMVDLSATQFDMPQHDFALAPLVLPVDDCFLRGDAQVYDLSGAMVTFAHQPALTNFVKEEVAGCQRFLGMLTANMQPHLSGVVTPPAGSWSAVRVA